MRLDSGDLAAHAKKVRAILDKGGYTEVRIFSSGNLDEYQIRELFAKGAPIDGFGVGTHMDTSSDAPYLDCAYKLMEYAGTGRRKRSEDKATWPGRKQVYRRYAEDGALAGDSLTIESDHQDGVMLIVPVMKQGKRLNPPEPLEDIRQRVQQSVARLPAPLRKLVPYDYPVEVSQALKDLTAEVDWQEH